jgi:hypothetical protein
MEVVPLLRWYALNPSIGVLCRVVYTQHASQVPMFSHFVVDLIGDLLRFVPFGYVGHDLFFDPLADFITESGVRFVEIGGVVLAWVLVRHIRTRGMKTYCLVPRWIRVWDEVSKRIEGLRLLNSSSSRLRRDGTRIRLWLNDILLFHLLLRGCGGRGS